MIRVNEFHYVSREYTKIKDPKDHPATSPFLNIAYSNIINLNSQFFLSVPGGEIRYKMHLRRGQFPEQANLQLDEKPGIAAGQD